MLIEPKQLTFQPTCSTKLIKIVNTTDYKYIFKVKITNTQMFTIYPGKGYVPPGQHVSITVTIKKTQKQMSAKLLLQYSELPADRDEMQWNQIPKGNIQDQLIPISQVKYIDKQQTRAGYKKTESPEYEPEISASHKSSSQSIKQKRASTESVSAQEPISTVYQTVRETHCNTFSLHRIGTTHTSGRSFENELKTEKQKNNELKKKLVEREMKLRQYQNAEQRQINHLTQNKDESYGVSFLNICLLILVCLMFGFMIAKSTPSSLPL